MDIINPGTQRWGRGVSPFIKKLKDLIATSDSFYTSCQSTLPWSYNRSGLRSDGYIQWVTIYIWVLVLIPVFLLCPGDEPRTSAVGTLTDVCLVIVKPLTLGPSVTVLLTLPILCKTNKQITWCYLRLFLHKLPVYSALVL